MLDYMRDSNIHGAKSKRRVSYIATEQFTYFADGFYKKAIDIYLFNNYNIIMIKFTWDESKNRINQTKHKVAFEEAKTVFQDEEAIVFDDPEHSGEEERFLIIGFTSKARLCIVSHCYRENDSVIRIISARKATTIEKAYYNEENGGQ